MLVTSEVFAKRVFSPLPSLFSRRCTFVHFLNGVPSCVHLPPPPPLSTPLCVSLPSQTIVHFFPLFWVWFFVVHWFSLPPPPCFRGSDFLNGDDLPMEFLPGDFLPFPFSSSPVLPVDSPWQNAFASAAFGSVYFGFGIFWSLSACFLSLPGPRTPCLFFLFPFFFTKFCP